MTEFEADLKDAEEFEKKQEAISKVGAFVPPESTYEDWTGGKYATRCLGKNTPCSLVQTSNPDDSSSDDDSDEDDSMQLMMHRDWKFSLGDMQEHRYSNPEVWEEDKVPHESTAHIEDVHKLVYEHFDPNMQPKDLDGPPSRQTGDFKSAWAIHEEQEEADHKAMMEAYSRPYKTVSERLIDDWTGHDFAKYWKTYGKPDPEQPPIAEKLNENGYSTGEPFHKPRPEPKEDEATFVQDGDPTREWRFSMGDMQEHKYANQDAWE